MSCFRFLYRALRYTFILLFISACSLESSPWSVAVKSDHKDLTQKNLDKLFRQKPVYTKSQNIRFAIIGDPQGTPEDFKRTIDEINQRQDVNFVLVLGDITDYGLLHEYEWAADVIESSRIPVLTVIGNHDAIAHGKKIYTRMFGPFDYSFEYAGYRFLMWNNNLYEFGDENFAWLQENANEKSIVASHVPPVLDMHEQDDLDTWYSINQQNNIIGSLHGHRGGKTSFLWQDQEKPYYVVARNRGERFALITITDNDKLNIVECHKSCPVEDGQ